MHIIYKMVVDHDALDSSHVMLIYRALLKQQEVNLKCCMNHT